MLSKEQIASLKSAIQERDTLIRGDTTYGVRAVLDEPEEFVLGSGESGYVRFAEDDCGNYYVLKRPTGEVFFWDHETDETRLLSPSLSSFVDELQPMPEIELRPDQVKEVWVDPEFLKLIKAQEKWRQ